MKYLSLRKKKGIIIIVGLIKMTLFILVNLFILAIAMIYLEEDTCPKCGGRLQTYDDHRSVCSKCGKGINHKQ